MIHVHISPTYPEEAMAHLRGLLRPEVGLTSGETIAPETTVLVNGRPTPEQLDRLPHLQAIIVPWAGLPRTLAAIAPDYPHLTIHNLHHNAIPVAEMALTLLLTAARQVLPLDRSLRQGDWRPRYEQWGTSLLLQGKTVLILGYGTIGRQVGRYCQALGMRVWATRRRPENDHDGVADIYAATALHDLLPQSQAVIVCLPKTADTIGYLGRRELALLPDGAVLVNIGRGEVIDEGALYEEVRNGRIAAALDVWYNYPAGEEARAHTPPANYPFHELDNVVFSPHRAGSTDQTNRLRMDHLAQLLNAAAAGQPLPNRIDVTAGY
ncbi:MAG: 2-hydroxyacid dehydrogenase [Chloroflexota bacterium]|jgi:phosphoglycerate dehydrogenase-like enzyme